MSDLQTIATDMMATLESLGHARTTAVGYGLDDDDTRERFDNIEQDIKQLFMDIIEKI